MEFYSFRSSLESLKNQGDVISIEKEVDPIYQIASITKALDGSMPLLFENIKGYPKVRVASNLFSRRELFSRFFGVGDPKKLKFKYLKALQQPITQVLVDKAPCQQNVITEGIDIEGTLPIIKHTEIDGARVLGGGNLLFSREDGGNCIGFRRMVFRDKNWGTVGATPGSHLEMRLMEARKKGEKVPVTINIGCPPSVIAVAGVGYLNLSMPYGSDEIGIAGGLQDTPVELCKAKTVNEFSVAQSEWVIEGYIDTNQVVYETEESEKHNETNKYILFPEYTGYMGKAHRTFKFEATAITHRDNPIFYAPLAHSIESTALVASFTEASFYEIGNRIAPGLIMDINILDGFKSLIGVIIQIRKRRSRDEGYQRNVLQAAFSALNTLRIAIVVDDDIDIYNAEEIWWAIGTRVDPKEDILVYPELRGGGATPVEREPGMRGEIFWRSSKVGIDATVPYHLRGMYTRALHPEVDLTQFLSSDEIKKAISYQTEYARSMAQRRF